MRRNQARHNAKEQLPDSELVRYTLMYERLKSEGLSKYSTQSIVHVDSAIKNYIQRTRTIHNLETRNKLYEVQKFLLTEIARRSAL